MIIFILYLEGEDTRRWGPPFIDGKSGRESCYFLSVNRNKKSIGINFKHNKGKSVPYEDIMIFRYNWITQSSETQYDCKESEITGHWTHSNPTIDSVSVYPGSCL